MLPQFYHCDDCNDLGHSYRERGCHSCEPAVLASSRRKMFWHCRQQRCLWWWWYQKVECRVSHHQHRDVMLCAIMKEKVAHTITNGLHYHVQAVVNFKRGIV